MVFLLLFFRLFVFYHALLFPLQIYNIIIYQRNISRKTFKNGLIFLCFLLFSWKMWPLAPHLPSIKRMNI